MYQITILPEGRIIRCDDRRKSLWSLLLEHGTPVEGPCGGTGICGKCKVRVLEGNPDTLTEEEDAVFSPREILDGWRLACLCYPLGNMVVVLPRQKEMANILSNGLGCDMALQPAIQTAAVSLSKKQLAGARSAEVLCRKQTGCLPVEPAALSALPTKAGRYTAVLHQNRLLAVRESTDHAGLYGLAVDIGTTTVVMSLVDIKTGAELAAESAVNPQNRFGQDVLSRIAYAGEHGRDGVARLQTAITELLEELKNTLCLRQGIPADALYEMSIGANSTMTHLLLGVEPESLGRLPFVPVFTDARQVWWRALCPQTTSPALQVYSLPGVSAYIGSDVVAGAFVARLQEREGISLLVDIGTNGEIVLARDGRLLSCSCAAGPALEGMNISCGMRAQKGAAEEIHIREGRIELEVIGGGEAAGLCGSGVLAALRECLREGLIKPGGALLGPQQLPEESPYRSWLCAVEGKKALRLGGEESGILLTQRDIRQIQLAKAAILSGFLALLRQQGLSLEQLDRVYIAGQFGAHLPVESLVGCGILPPGLEERVEYIGNTSKSGAMAALLNTQARQELEALAASIEYVELGAVADYERLLVEAMGFPQAETIRERRI